jgi:hypothetical protein
MADRTNHWRRTHWTAAAGVAVLASLTPLSMAGVGAEQAVEAGEGLAGAQTAKFDPKAGGLSIGITFGQATANHQNQVAKALSNATHMGVVGTTLAAEGCDGSDATWAREEQPQALVVDSRDEGAEEGKSQTDQGIFAKAAKADDTPYAEATTRLAPFAIPGVIEMGPGIAQTSSGFLDGLREARATVDIDYLHLGPTVKLGQLRWDVVHQSTKGKNVEGRFTIGSAVIDGEQQNTHDPSATLDEANKALSRLGLKLTPGRTHVTQGMVVIEPLALSVVPNAQRDAAAGAVLGGAQQVRKPLFDAILAKYCKAGTYISVFDIAVGSLTGAGEFVLSLGGAQASSGDVPKNTFNLDFGAAGTLPGLYIPPIDPTFSAVPAYEAVTPGIAGTATPGTAGTPSTRRTRVVPAGHTGPPPFKGTRGGALAVVGLVTLGVVAIVAEGDRRTMRSALRQAAEAAR